MPSARENQATFAFGRARAELALGGHIVAGQTRKLLAADPNFAEVFKAKRIAVAAMNIRYVEVNDPEFRTVFEVYAAVMLHTENTFETH